MSLVHSAKAFNAKSIFCNKIIVYVEGKTDIPFWDYFFNECGIKCEIKAVGGCTNFEYYINELNNNEIQFIIAKDSDYKRFREDFNIKHNEILTPCYSIENMIFCEQAIVNFLLILCNKTKNDIDEIYNKVENERKAFTSKFIDLLYFDILNDVKGKGYEILSRGYEYVKNNISTYNNLDDKFSEDDKNDLIIDKKNLEDDFFITIRGHFLETWSCEIIHKIASNYGKIKRDINIIRAALLKCECENKCILYNKLKESIISVYDNINNNLIRRQ